MGIVNIINKTLSNIQSLNAIVKVRSTVDKNTPFRAISGSGAAPPTTEGSAIESLKGNRVFLVELGSPPVDLGSLGLTNVLLQTELRVIVRYDWEGSMRTHSLSAEDGALIIATLMNPNNFIQEMESIAPPTVSYERPSSDTMLLVLSFPLIYFESILSNL